MFNKLGHRIKKSAKNTKKDNICAAYLLDLLNGSHERMLLILIPLIYVYFSFIMSMICAHIESRSHQNNYLLSFSFHFMDSIRLHRNALPSLCTVYIKIAFFLLCCNGPVKRNCSKLIQSNKRVIRLLNCLLYFTFFLNFLLIGICNPSLLNPGPNTLSVSYQNVQGLIPFSQLGKAQPNLDHTKIYELNAHIETAKPDIVILNETWLKGCIKSQEVVLNPNYDVFRNDRSQVTHPADPNNPNKYRKFGGGVLIAVRSNIQASSKRISMRKGAEILAIELTVGNSRYVFCTVYRVGTLGESNHDSICESIKSLYSGRNLRKIFLIGDFNLSSVSWQDQEVTPTRIDKMFVDSFAELGLQQCITDPTHVKGKTLDILLTNQSGLISDIKMGFSICKSDHYPINFTVKLATKNNWTAKRKIWNFKKANWDQLNKDLSKVPWNTVVGRKEPDIAWKNFKIVLFALVGKHIPSITIKNDFSAPWFDSDCFVSYRNKERAHNRLKENPTLENDLKRNVARREFKNKCNEKMRDNLYNSDDPSIITKKFWSHVKSSSKSHRLPECMHFGSMYRSAPLDKANLFNDFFCEQFSDASSYNIDINWSNDETFDIDFNPHKISKLLASMNSNKAQGPDEIHGKILKNCASS